MASNTRVLTPFGLTMLIIIAIASLRDVPQVATYGLGSVTIYLAAAIFFFIPIAMITAELVSTWPDEGGSYFWIKKAFGQHIAFVCLVFYWLQNVLWYPVITTYGATSFAYFWDPVHAAALAQDPLYISCFIITAQWLQTAILFRGGLQFMGKFSEFSALLGFLLPAGVLVVAVSCWLWSGMPSYLHLSPTALIPQMKTWGDLTFAVTVVLAFMGIEMTCTHVKNLQGGYQAFVTSIAAATVCIVCVFILAALAVAVALPHDSIVLQSGLVASLKVLLTHFHLEYLARYLSLCMTIGVIGSVSAWLTGPSRMMLVAAEEGILPKVFAYQWKNTAPRMIVLESVLVTLAATLFFVYPSVTEAYFTLSDCAVQLYLIVYFVIIFAAITLRIRYPNQQSSFRIPGGVFGLCCSAVTALVGCGAAFLIGFIPPSQFSLVNPHYFSLFILGVIFITAGLASGLYQYRRRYGYLR